MQAWRGAAAGGFLLNPGNPSQQLSPGLRRWLAAVFLFGAAHSCFRSGVGLSLGRYRVSSLAFAPAAEKQVQCSALGFLNSCPSAETRQSAKLSGRAGLWGGPSRGGGRGACPSPAGTRGFGVGSGVPTLRASLGRSWPLGRLGVRRGGGEGPGWAGVPRVGVRDTRRVGDARHSRPLGGLGCGEGREDPGGRPRRGGAGAAAPAARERARPAEPCGT